MDSMPFLSKWPSTARHVRLAKLFRFMVFPPAFMFNKLLFPPRFSNWKFMNTSYFHLILKIITLELIFSFKNRTLEFNIYKETHLIFVENSVK